MYFSQFCMPIEIDAEDPYYTGGVCMPAVRSFTVLPCDDGELLCPQL